MLLELFHRWVTLLRAGLAAEAQKARAEFAAKASKLARRIANARLRKLKLAHQDKIEALAQEAIARFLERDPLELRADEGFPENWFAIVIRRLAVDEVRR